MCIYTYLSIRLHSIKTCLCCFLDMHLYCNNLSTIAMISSRNMLEILPACFSCSNSFNLFHNSSRLSGKTIVVTPEAILAGDLSNFSIDLSLSLFRPCFLIIKFFSFPNS